MRKSTNFSKLLLLVAAAYPLIRGQTLQLPTTVQIDIVFPRQNTTYPPTASFPLVFALQGASAAWTFGYFLEWRIRLSSTQCETQCGVIASGGMSIDTGISVSFGDEDSYVYLDNAQGLNGSGGENGTIVLGGRDDGEWLLEWDFGFARNCSQIEGGGVANEGGRIAATGSVVFATGTGAVNDVRMQLGECPAVGGAVGVVADLDGCPELGDTAEGDEDACDVEVPEDVVEEVAGRFSGEANGGGQEEGGGGGQSGDLPPVTATPPAMPTQPTSTTTTESPTNTTTGSAESLPQTVATPTTDSNATMSGEGGLVPPSATGTVTPAVAVSESGRRIQRRSSMVLYMVLSGVIVWISMQGILVDCS